MMKFPLNYLLVLSWSIQSTATTVGSKLILDYKWGLVLLGSPRGYPRKYPGSKWRVIEWLFFICFSTAYSFP